MSRWRSVVLAAVAALAAGGLATIAALPACYDIPQPACGFRCGPAGECPADYTCNSGDGRCHLNGSPADLVCGTPDAGVDAEIDATVDAIDAPVDAIDAPPDAAIDAAIDAPPDAAIDAAIDAP